jgi:Arc/MetJ-type ribon-helix-helix transcriptional regulator
LGFSLNTGVNAGIVTSMKSTGLKKVTLELPEELLRHAQEETQQGLTETIRQGLQLLTARRAGRALAKLRGKVDLQLNITEMRKDRKT